MARPMPKTARFTIEVDDLEEHQAHMLFEALLAVATAVSPPLPPGPVKRHPVRMASNLPVSPKYRVPAIEGNRPTNWKPPARIQTR